MKESIKDFIEDMRLSCSILFFLLKRHGFKFKSWHIKVVKRIEGTFYVYNEGGIRKDWYKTNKHYLKYLKEQERIINIRIEREKDWQKEQLKKAEKDGYTFGNIYKKLTGSNLSDEERAELKRIEDERAYKAAEKFCHDGKKMIYWRVDKPL